MGSEYVTISVRFYILLVILVLFSCQFVSEQMATGRHNNTDEMCTFRLLPLILIVINSKRNGYRLIFLHFYPSISVLASLIVPVDMEYVWVSQHFPRSDIVFDTIAFASKTTHIE